MCGSMSVCFCVCMRGHSFVWARVCARHLLTILKLTRFESSQTPGLEGRDKLDNYIDNTKKRARARVPHQPAHQAQKPPKTPIQRTGAGVSREARALKRLISRGEGTRGDGGGRLDGMEDEDEDDMEMDMEEEQYDEDGDILASPI